MEIVITIILGLVGTFLSILAYYNNIFNTALKMFQEKEFGYKRAGLQLLQRIKRNCIGRSLYGKEIDTITKEIVSYPVKFDFSNLNLSKLNFSYEEYNDAIHCQFDRPNFKNTNLQGCNLAGVLIMELEYSIFTGANFHKAIVDIGSNPSIYDKNKKYGIEEIKNFFKLRAYVNNKKHIFLVKLIRKDKQKNLYKLKKIKGGERKQNIKEDRKWIFGPQMDEKEKNK